MSDDPDRDAILARRRRFIAVALSGLAATSACPQPQVCLNIAPPATSSPLTPPMPCLSPPEPSNTPVPQPCLEIAEPIPSAPPQSAAGPESLLAMAEQALAAWPTQPDGLWRALTLAQGVAEDESVDATLRARAAELRDRAGTRLQEEIARARAQVEGQRESHPTVAAHWARQLQAIVPDSTHPDHIWAREQLALLNSAPLPSATPSARPTTPPRVCLRRAPPRPSPQVCLRYAPPADGDESGGG